MPDKHGAERGHYTSSASESLSDASASSSVSFRRFLRGAFSPSALLVASLPAAVVALRLRGGALTSDPSTGGGCALSKATAFLGGTPNRA